MDTSAYDRWNEQNEADRQNYFAQEMLGHDVWALPEDEDSLVVCPECGELAESFVLLEHRSWCSRR